MEYVATNDDHRSGSHTSPRGVSGSVGDRAVAGTRRMTVSLHGRLSGAGRGMRRGPNVSSGQSGSPALL